MHALFSDPDMLAFIAAVITVLAGLYWNFRSAKSARKIPFLEKQIALCFEASQTVSVLATTSDAALWASTRDRFWQLFWGPLAIVEDKAVEATMVQCRAFIPLTGLPDALPLTALQPLSLALSHEIRRLLLRTWKVTSLELELENYGGVVETARQAYRAELARQLQKKGS